MNSEWQARYEAAIAAAEKAGQLALRYFNGEFTVELKADQTPVTVADRQAEELLRAELLGRFPRDAFLGEEFAEQDGDSGFRWIIDPIDGTRSYVRGIPIWATLVGLEYKDEPIAGVVVVPAMQQTYRALRGEGAYRNEQRMAVSRVKQLSDATLFYTSLKWFAKAGRQEDFIEIVKRTQTQRGFGDFYGHVLVAQGSGELMVEHGVKVWDVGAIYPIVVEAGGQFTDWEGNPTIRRPDVLISNGLVHAEVLRLLQSRQVVTPG
jgi:histidinol-phosphatase